MREHKQKYVTQLEPPVMLRPNSLKSYDCPKAHAFLRTKKIQIDPLLFETLTPLLSLNHFFLEGAVEMVNKNIIQLGLDFKKN